MLTLGGESHGLMVRGRCLSKRGQVAAHAFGGESEAIELSDRADFVAGITVDGRMCADERKSILMLIDVVNGNLPAVRVMAQFALHTVLAAM